MSDKLKRAIGRKHWHPRLVLMMKAPQMGRVKTRLARDIGFVRATHFYRTLSHHLIRRLSFDPRWQTYLAITPDRAVDQTFWQTSLPAIKGGHKIKQGPGDLGAKMQRLFNRLPPGPVIIIGSDIPQISAPLIAEAFYRLNSSDCLIGPADDGGYWLIGQRRSPKPIKIFDQVKWSTTSTFDDTIANLKGRSLAKMPVLVDVDSGPQYKALWEGACGSLLRVSALKY